MLKTITSTKGALDLKRFSKYRVGGKESKDRKRGFALLTYGDTGVGKTMGLFEIGRFLWEYQQRPCIVFSNEGQKTVNNAEQYSDIYPDFPLYVVELDPGKTIWGRVTHLETEIKRLNAQLKKQPKSLVTVGLDSATGVWGDLIDWLTYSPEISRQKVRHTLPDGTVEESYSPMPTEWRKATKRFEDILKNLSHHQSMFFNYTARPKLDRDMKTIIGASLDSKYFGVHYATMIIKGKLGDKGRLWTLEKLDMLAKGAKGQLVGWTAKKKRKARGYLNFKIVNKLANAAMGIDLKQYLETGGDVDSTEEGEKTETKTIESGKPVPDISGQ